MAKKKNNPEDDEVTYLGQSIDPDIQKKVAEYMDLEEDEVAPTEATDDPQEDNPDEVENAQGAPLLPTDQLPDAVKPNSPSSKKSKITVFHDEAEELAPETETVEQSSVDNVQEAADTVKSTGKKISVIDHDEAVDDLVTDEATPLGEESSDEAGPTAVDEVEVIASDDLDSAQPGDTPEVNEVPDSASKETDSEEPLDNEDESEDDDEPLKLQEEEIEALSDAEEDDFSPSEGETVDDYLDELADNVGDLPTALPAEELIPPAPRQKSKIQSSIPMDDAVTSQAIADIIATDSDQILAIEDKKRSEATVEPTKIVPKKAKPTKKKSASNKWWRTKVLRNLVIILVLLGITAGAALPTSRYFVLNKLGVKVSTSMIVLDDKTSLPLKNVELIVAGKSAKSDGEGRVALSGVPLGKQQIVVKKPAFADYNKTVVLGWGSNPLGEYRLTPTGIRYSLTLVDWLSDKPIKSGEVAYKEFSAKISEKGEAILTLPKVEESEIVVEIKAAKYRTEKITIDTAKTDPLKKQLVASEKHIYVSKQSGKFDLYSADIDGKNQQLLVAGSGLEKQETLAIAVSPKRNIVAYTASRENTRNQDGFLLNTLYMVDTETKETKKITQTERIQVIDWVGDKFIYVKVAQGASEADSNRTRLMAYDLESGQEKELASTNYFNDVIAANGAIYYSPAQYQVNGSVGLYKINTDGSGKKTIFQKEVWNLFRTTYDKVSLSVGQDWYELNLDTDALVKVGGAPSVLKSRVYIASDNGQNSLWIDERDGKSVLMNYSKTDKSDKILVTQSGIKHPVRWLDDGHIIYRVSDGQETADYVVAIEGGQPKKIRDVTNTTGVDRWYYF